MTAYDNVHKTVKRAWGPASLHECTWCGCTASDWALDWTYGDISEDERGRFYSADWFLYIPLCRTCHRTFDVAHARDPDGLVAAIPGMRQAAWDRTTEAKRELDAKRRADQIRLFLKCHFPQAVTGA